MEHNRPTLVDVARVADVSRSTASRALNDQPGVSAEIRDRVRRAATALDYHPDASARALASGRMDVIHLVVVEKDAPAFASSSYYARVIAGLVSALAGTDAQMRLDVVDGSDAARVLDDIAGSNALGTLLVNVAAPLAERFYRRCPRVVSLGHYADGVPYSEAESADGVEKAVRHLLAGGRRQIAAIDGPQSNPCARERHTGYLNAMAAAGQRPLWTEGDFTRQGGYAATLRILSWHPDVDAIVAACDCTAAGVLQALADSGRRVPGDVAVVGFDDSELAASTSPPLTSVHQPVEEMARRAARDLIESRVGPGWRQTFPVSLSVRASTGFAA
jgi:DNA-binding LacI/PurR family transcriptional regulator